MGFVFTKIFSWLKSNDEVRLLILGLDNAGKTTILCKDKYKLLDKMQLGDVVSTVPSM